MKITIVGAGAMGSLFGARLAQAGCQVILYDIFREHVEAINSGGLAIEDLASGETQVCRPRATTDAAEAAGSDLLIIFVKSANTEQAARQFAPLAGKDAIALTLQNGLGNERLLSQHFGARRTAAGVTSQGATFLGPGRVRHAGRGPTHIGMSDGHNEPLVPVAELLTRAGFETHLEENLDSLIWSKLIINVGINALTALTGLPNGRLLEFAETRSLMADLVDEAVAVARARGVPLTYAEPLVTVYQVAEKTGKNRSSMLQDFDRGRVSEIDFINGAIVREAEELGLQAPVNRAVTRLVRSFDVRRGERAEGGS